MGVSGAPGVRAGSFERMGEAGVEVFRMAWSQTQLNPRPGVYRWDKLDQIVLAAARAEISVLPILYRAEQRRPAPPADPGEKARWIRFVRDAIDRYGPGGRLWLLNPVAPRLELREWQVWNEPNLRFFWHGNPDPAAYAELLKITANAIREEDPAATVVLAGLNSSARGRLAPPRYLDELYRHGTRNAFDAAAVHPYARSPLEVRARIIAVRGVMELHGELDTPLWVTEVGWSTAGEEGHRLVTSLDKQARRARLTFLFMRRLERSSDVDRVLWFSWSDHADRGCGWCGGTGLIDAAGGAKPALDEFSLAAHLFGR